uniref:Calx-beta domain-containing protein n=1 Tax=Candidatus Chloroploca sp. Khr17 TaxID=2496869 RepID=UPI00272E6A52
ALTSQPTTTVTVNLTVPGGVTTSASSLAFTAANWTAPQTVTVTATENAIAEGNRVVTLTHAVASTALGYAGLAVDAVAVTITDNDNAGFILSESAVTLAEGAVFTYTVELTSQPTATVSLNLNEPTTLAVIPTILSFTDTDWATPQTVTVTALDDDIARGERTLAITHTITTSDPVYAALNAPVVEVTVSEDDTAGLTVLPPTIALSEDPTALDNTGVFSLTLESRPLADVTITLTPDAQVDVAPTTLVFTVDRWNESQNVTVTALDDAIVEPSPHTGIIEISSASTDANYNRTWPDYTVSITDNDVAGIEVVAPSSQFTSEDGDAVTMTLRLTSQPTASVSIDVTSSDISEGAVSAANGLPLVFDATNWAVPQIVTITGVDDDLFDGLQAYNIEVQPAVSADPNYAGLQPVPASFALSNTDNERTRVSIGDAGPAIGGTLRYPLTLTRPISDAIEIGFEIILINTLDGTSSVSATDTLIIVPNAITSTITLAVEPAFEQPNRFVAVRLISAAPTERVVLGNRQGLGWVLPDPVTTPTVRFAQAEALVTIGDTGTATVRLDVVLDVAPTEPVTIDYDLATGGTADAADYTFTPGSLTFATGEITQTIDVIINGRPSSQLYKTIRLGLTNPSTNATLGDPNIATITIVYNEITWPNDVTGYVGYMFTAGPNIPAERGYYYINNVTLADGREGYSYAFIGVPCSWEADRPLSIQLFSPGLHNSTDTLDTILNTPSMTVTSNLSDAGNTFFELYGPDTELGPAVNMPGPGADGSLLGQQIFAPTSNAEQWQTVWTIPAPACGRYILRSATEGDDMNNWAVRAGWYAAGDDQATTAPRVDTATGEIITLGMSQTTVKNYVTRYATRYANDEFCLTKWFYVPPATASLTLQQYDLDRQVDIRLRVRFYRPSDLFDPRALQGGLAPANPVSGEALWERDTFANPEAGWWRSVVCTPYQDNAYVLDALADGVKLPLTVNPPPPAPDLLTTVTGASMTAEVTPTVALTLTYENRALLATALRPTLTVNLPPQLTFPADVCAQIADPCQLENGALIIQPARVAPGALGTYQVPAVVTPGSQGTALIQLETRFQDVMGNRYRNGWVSVPTLP